MKLNHKPKYHMNQYELVITMAEYIRQHPEDPVVPKLKACKTQAEQMEIFGREILKHP